MSGDLTGLCLYMLNTHSILTQLGNYQKLPFKILQKFKLGLLGDQSSDLVCFDMWFKLDQKPNSLFLSVAKQTPFKIDFLTDAYTYASAGVKGFKLAYWETSC